MKNYNPFQVLGLDDRADINQVKERYRELSKVFHPDKQPTSNYEDAKKQFHEIDKAYKTLSTKFNMMVFEYFGIDGRNINGMKGIQLLVTNHSKFEDLEEEFNNKQAQGLGLRPLIKRIRQRIRLVQFKILENDLYSSTYSKIEIYPSFYAGQDMLAKSYIHHKYWLAFQRKQELITHIALPRFKEFSQDLYFYLCHTENFNGIQNTAQEYGHKAQYQLISKKFGQFNLGSQIGKSEDQFHGMLDVSKQLPNNINANLQLKFMQSQITPVLNLSYTNNQNNMKIWLGQGGLETIGTHFGFKDFDIEVTASNDSIILQTNMMVEKHQYYSTSIVFNLFTFQKSGIIKIVQVKGATNLMILLKSNFKWKISKLMIFEMRSTIGLGSNQLEIIFSRGHARISIPILYENTLKPTNAIILFTLPFILPLLWKNSKIRQPWQNRVREKIKKRKQELVELEKINLQVQDNISKDEDFIRKLQREDQDGLIIIEAYIGLNVDIIKLVKLKSPNNEEQKNCLTFIPCKNQLQLMVMQGYLFLRANTVQQLPGLFLLDSQLPISEYSGYVIYKLNNQQKIQSWNLSCDLTIGFKLKTLNRFSLVQLMIQYMF